MKRLVPWAVILFLCLGCTSAAQPEEASAPEPRPAVTAQTIEAPRPIELPADDGPHDVLTEWWYYNGHLEGDGGQRYGFDLVVFKRGGRGGRAGYAGHVAVTDHQRRAFQFAEDLSLPPPGDITPGRFQVAVGDISAAGGNGGDTLRGTTAGYSIDLELVQTKPPAVHGVTGYIGVSATEASYYYSRTRMAASGVLRDHGVPISVTGQAWMDHQWGDFSLQGGGGWDWYSVQLDDGVDLMFSVVRDARNEVVLAYGTLVEPQGDAVHLPKDRFRARSLERWTSPETGTVYPMGWQLEVPERGLDLRLDPVIPEQEMLTTASVNATYWEGQVLVSGSARGWGYVELTGYGR